jgi:carboxymethylenebutenolidase
MTTALAEQTPLYVVGSTNAPRALIVIQEAFGVNDHIRSVADRFADQGYLVVAPELYHRTRSPQVAYDDFPTAREHMEALNKADIETDLRAAASYLNNQGYPTSSIGIVGYCMGGTVTFFAATLGIVGAAAAYYGSGLRAGRFGFDGQIAMAPHITAPVIGFYGDLDASIPVEEVEELRAALAETSQATEVVRYADAHHGFHCDGRPAVYGADAAADAYERTLAFFATHLEPR